MALHLIKLCVGAESIDDLRDWVAERTSLAIAAGLPPHSVHVTRMSPKRSAEILDGGSLYWVIKGVLSARQQLIGIEDFTDNDGIGRCRLMLAPDVIETMPQPKRPFQGWRYLETKDAPADLMAGGLGEMPADLKRELAELGLL
ncbi:hypothetical protein M2360_005241 [Rhizobium sp. SG_E_25_P2]|uniref:DUF1489 family protein n=1 Tax=Rhizobium sp. SG_E_25_P2 TaxID=2879942 RepID=UPI002473EF29|nr:DUF1489 family protein [Rhizobium sp. SG_E_25_P2]MDH6269809.1 hypothetical protein [Rhizobium sp. SG_E_25_P2]